MAEVKSQNAYQKLLTLGGRYHYAWVVAVASSIVTFIGVEPLALFGVFLEPISKDLGASRGAVSAVYWIAYFCLGISSIASGWATDNIGIRKTLIIATIATVVPLMLLAQARELWQLYLWYGVVCGLARSGFYTPTVLTITLWFKKKQGLAVGIVSSGLAVGPMFFAPLFRYLIDAYGWNNAFFILGIITGMILAPCCWIIRNRPSDMGLPPYGDTDEKEVSGVPVITPSYQPLYYRTDISNFFMYAMKTQPFFLLPLIHFVGCISHAIPLAHVVVMATDKGIDPIAASTVLGIATGVSATSRLAAPMLSDKIGGRKVLILFILMQGISILWLLPAKELWLFFIFSVFFGLGYGGEMTPFPILNRQYYGTAPIGMIYGFQAMIACIGMGIGGFIGGFLYDLMGNYTLAIWVAVLTGFAGAGLSYLLVDPFKPGNRQTGLIGVKREPTP
jgi:OFA family oxalate/formate antiporter-like MFS transporter